MDRNSPCEAGTEFGCLTSRNVDGGMGEERVEATDKLLVLGNQQIDISAHNNHSIERERYVFIKQERWSKKKKKQEEANKQKSTQKEKSQGSGRRIRDQAEVEGERRRREGDGKGAR